MKVQELLSDNPSGYQHKKDVDERPLTRLIKCHQCKGYMVGYKNNKKRLHYYRCLKCTGVSQNAHSTPKEKKKSAEAIFKDLLMHYEIPEKFAPLIEMQLKKLFEHYNQDSQQVNNNLERNYSELQK